MHVECQRIAIVPRINDHRISDLWRGCAVIKLNGKSRDGGFPARERLITQRLRSVSKEGAAPKSGAIPKRTSECDFNHTLPANVTGQCRLTWVGIH
jgi:hypothetical protein